MKQIVFAVILCSAALVAAGGDRPLTELPYTPSLETGFMDRSVDPCVDFYSYACGGWMEKNPIPGDQSRWSVYGKLYTLNQQFLWGILEDAAEVVEGRDPLTAQIGDYFAACMDESRAEKLGSSPLEADLEALSGLESKNEIAVWLANVHLSVDSSMLFGFSADQDLGNSAQIIAWASASGLGLPDRDYYVNDDERSVKTRHRYVQHVETMLALSGLEAAAASKGAATVLRLETALAKASLTRVERRDPHKIFNTMSTAKLAETAPAFAWVEFFLVLGVSVDTSINVTQPGFFAELGRLLATESLETWKTYLRWHLVSAQAPYLAERFVRADFEFNRAYLRGVKEMPPRWKQCVGLVDRDLGQVLGKVFVDRVFPASVKAEAVKMTVLIEKMMGRRVDDLVWMSETTKTQAKKKLESVRNKVGYPDHWIDYSSIEVERQDLAGNVRRASVFDSRRELAKIGKPVDRTEWSMTPPTVNAYYSPSMNDINFPAGVLLPPLYDPKMDDAPNFGNTGGTIGHELIHGFDDSGSQFDAAGNLRNWWTEEDGAEFKKRTQCIADQYAEYVVIDDIKINSQLTLGEDVADLGGVVLAWDAWLEQSKSQRLRPVDGLNPDQRFFIGFAQWACNIQRDEDKRVNAMTDPHSPGVHRINGVVVNMPEFAEAFSCEPGQPMVREDVCEVW